MLTVLWTFITGYLYFLVVLITLMLTPLFGPRRWNNIMCHSRFFEVFREKTVIIFYSWAFLLDYFFLASIIALGKYAPLTADMKDDLNLCTAQRNFHIVGLASFLTLVLRKLSQMIIDQHEIGASAIYIVKKAQNTIERAETMAKTITTTQENNFEMCAKLKNKLDFTNSLMKVQKLRINDLEKEITMWRLKYEKVINDKESQGNN